MEPEPETQPRTCILPAFRSYCAPPPRAGVSSADGVVTRPPGAPLAGYAAAAGHAAYIAAVAAHDDGDGTSPGRRSVAGSVLHGTSGSSAASKSLSSFLSSCYDPTQMRLPQWLAFASAAFREVPG